MIYRTFELAKGSKPAFKITVESESELRAALEGAKWSEPALLAWALWQGMEVHGHSTGDVREVKQ